MSCIAAFLILRSVAGFMDDGCSQAGFSADGPAQKVLLEDAAKLGAVCLDGSPAAYYFQPGSGDGINKWYIHHEGGGWCENLAGCLLRSKSDLGSSKAYPDTANLGGGYFSTDATENPMMHNWNHVKMRYCDGASFSGNNATVTSYFGTKLYFRGKLIREAMAKDLFQRGMASATDLVVSGCSAGGLATYLSTDWWCNKLQNQNADAKCVGLPDSGFFLDYQGPHESCDLDDLSDTPEISNGKLGFTFPGNYHCGMKRVFTMQNATAGVHEACISAHAGQEWKCMFAEHTSEHIRTPIFAMQSQYDSWQMHFVLPLFGKATQDLGDNITARLQSMLMAHNPESGAFLDSCSHHCSAAKEWNSIRIDGDLTADAFQQWYDGLNTASKKLWNQNQSYPCEACCKPDADVLTV